MPEIPDLEAYREALSSRIVGRRLCRLLVLNPFLLRSTDPPSQAFEGLSVQTVERLGKRLVLGFDGELYLLLHLMLAGRLHWWDTPPKPTRHTLLRCEFEPGALTLSEAGSKRRASLHLVRGRAALAAFDAGGMELATVTEAEFQRRFASSPHTLKRAFTDPRCVSGVGNAYSDEILHRARLSPLARCAELDAASALRLLEAARIVLDEWTTRLRAETGTQFPEGVTAFRPDMAVHGRFGKPCPDCGATVQRIVHGERESNYCPRCQTGGKVLADRMLSRLLKADWPREVDEL